MSKNRSRRNPNWSAARTLAPRTYGTAEFEPSAQWWDEEIPTHRDFTWAQWQDAFASMTLSVVEAVWRREGRRLYRGPIYDELREDLRGWLVVEAQIIANKHLPDADHPAPELAWAAALHQMLPVAARWHFAEMVGREKDTHGRIEVYRSGGVRSTDHLDDLERLGGAHVDRHPLHGSDLLQLDPLALLIRLENLEATTAAVEGYLRAHGTYSTASVAGPCLVNLCTRPALARGLCQSHYHAERRLWKERRCNVPDCGRQHTGLGLCAMHYQQLKKGTLAAELHQYASTPREPVSNDGSCADPDCDAPAAVRGLCRRHYQRQYMRARRAASPEART